MIEKESLFSNVIKNRKELIMSKNGSKALMISMSETAWSMLRAISIKRGISVESNIRYSRIRNDLIEEAVKLLYEKTFPANAVTNSEKSGESSRNNRKLNELKILQMIDHFFLPTH